MAKTGLVIASGLAKAVDSFFKARKLRDLNAQAQSMEQIKYLKGLEDLNNSKLRGKSISQDISQSAQIFPSKYGRSQSESAIAAGEERLMGLREGLTKLPEKPRAIDEMMRYSAILGRSLPVSETQEISGSMAGTKLQADIDRVGAMKEQAKERTKYITQQLATSKASEGLINQRLSDAQYKNDALTKSAEPLGDPVFDQYFAPATALIADKPEQIAVYKSSIREALTDGQINTAQSMFRTATKGSMSATDRGDTRDMEIVVESTSRIKDELDEYYRLGGSTSLFDSLRQDLSESAISQAVAKIAEEQNPALQRVTLSIKDEFFRFRQAVSGAAFSPEETADYYKLWPQSEKGQSVNEGRVNSMLERASLKMAYQYMSAVGVPDIETIEKLIGQIYRYDVSQVSSSRSDPGEPFTPEQTERINTRSEALRQERIEKQSQRAAKLLELEMAK